jgi:hypothetical protein
VGVNPFEDFKHFIAYFVPGVALFFAVLGSVSLIEGNNSLVQGANFLVILVGSTIAGLFLDEARHTWLEPWLEGNWAHRRRFDLTKLDDFLAYVPKIGTDLYELIRDEHYYYYEFDINMSLVLIPGSAVAVMYLTRFQILKNSTLAIVLWAVLLGLARCFWIFGKNAYDYFLDTFVNTMDRKEAGFKKSIGR